MFRFLCLSAAAVGLVSAQAMSEMSAAATGGLVGAAAGKGVSAGITAVLGKVDQLAKESADDKDKGKGKDKGKDKGGKDKGAPVIQLGAAQEVGPVPRAYSVPDPPPSRFARKAFVAQGPVLPPVPEVVAEPVVLKPVIPLPTLASIEPGTDRDTVAKIAAPAVRITMYEDRTIS